MPNQQTVQIANTVNTVHTIQAIQNTQNAKNTKNTQDTQVAPDIRAILQAPGDLEKDIRYWQDMVKHCDIMASEAPSPSFDGPGVKTGRADTAPFVYWIHKKEETKAKVEDLRHRQDEAVTRVLELIESLPRSGHRRVLFLRYISLLPIREIEMELGVTRISVYRWQREAIGILEGKENPPQ